MGKVRILDEHLSNQIAAGEVIERPSSVVKELVENAIDAQATRIHIQVKEGGVSLIRVSDNGVGMEKEDALLSFSRHATSKIVRNRDLFSIRTLGFRGEALPSIASVAKVTLTTGQDASQLATSIHIEGGDVKKVEEISRSQGTDVSVSELFYNTPARLKYLKTTNTEIAHIADLVGRVALANPNISFLLYHNDRELFRSMGDGKVHHVLHALYGRGVSNQLVSFQAENMDFSIQGFLTKPEITRSSRSYMSIVINGRYVRSHPIVHAILRGFGTLIPNGRYPLGILQLVMDPKIVDVNVHPAKLEVRISKEKECYGFIEQEIKQALHKEFLVPKAPLYKVEQTRQPELVQESFQWKPKGIQNEKAEQGKEEFTYESSPLAKLSIQEEAAVTTEPRQYEEEPKEQSVVESQQQNNAIPLMCPLAQIHGTYIIAQSEDGFFLIDQHAAHERIYYERFMEKLGGENRNIQELLVPLTIEASPGDKKIIELYLDTLNAWGLSLEPFGGTTFIIRSYPSWFPQGAEELIHEIFFYLKKHGKVETERLRDATVKMMSCKAAIKANRHLRIDEMEALLKDLMQCNIPYTCPHGRPIYVQFSSYDLEKMFKRVM